MEEPQRAQDATSRAQATLPASIDQPQIEHIVRGCREVSGEGNRDAARKLADLQVHMNPAKSNDDIVVSKNQAAAAYANSRDPD